MQYLSSKLLLHSEHSRSLSPSIIQKENRWQRVDREWQKNTLKYFKIAFVPGFVPKWAALSNMTDFIQRNIYILLIWDNTAWGDDGVVITINVSVNLLKRTFWIHNQLHWQHQYQEKWFVPQLLKKEATFVIISTSFKTSIFNIKLFYITLCPKKGHFSIYFLKLLMEKIYFKRI